MSEPIKKKQISFSQFSTYFSCGYKWFRDYVKKDKKFEDNLNMSMGSAIHFAIQTYLTLLYKETESKAEELDIIDCFVKSFKGEIAKKGIKSSDEEVAEFISDGTAILEEFVRPENRKRYFPREKYELLGIEMALNEPIFNNLNIVGFLDLVLKEKMTGNIKIIDFKTSTRGWSANEQEDFTKLAQLRLYKALYSKRYNIPLNKIQVEFFILKRKLYDESKCKFPQTRLKIFTPTSYKPDIDETLSEMSKFVRSCFTEDGEFITNKEYEKIPGLKNKNCKYCQYAKDGSCDQKKTPIQL